MVVDELELSWDLTEIEGGFVFVKPMFICLLNCLFEINYFSKLYIRDFIFYLFYDTAKVRAKMNFISFSMTSLVN